MENNNMKYINDEKITNLVIAMMCYIKDEWERCYWNVHQKQEDSPFVSGAYLSYKNDYVTIKRYDYGADEETPNLIVPGMQVIWYKHYKRGVDVYIDKDIEPTLEFFTDVLDKILKSIQEDKTMDTFY